MKDNLLFLDCETTGVEETDRLCQIAYKKGDELRNLYFKPPVPISVEAMSITHITNEFVADKAPFQGGTWYHRLKSFFADDRIVIIAHNAHFDLEMLKKEGLVLPAKHICTMKISHYHDAELQKNAGKAVV